MFCGNDEDTDHLFVLCPMIARIWNWITQYNNFTFIGNTIADLWDIIGSIPLKDKFAVFWVVWLERNKFCFTNKYGKTVVMLGSQILSLTKD
jgi:hypothetical protein